MAVTTNRGTTPQGPHVDMHCDSGDPRCRPERFTGHNAQGRADRRVSDHEHYHDCMDRRD